MRQIVLDTETTGLDPAQGHRVIEIGCVEMRERRLTGRNFHQYLQPDREIDKAAEEVHGISNAFLADKPRFGDIASDLMDYLRDAELIIHNAPFDVGFLNSELQRLQSEWRPLEQQCEITDTLVMAKKMHPGQRNSLDALCKRYDIDNSQRELHGALLDSEILAEVYLAMTGGQAALLLDAGDETGAGGDSVIRRLPQGRTPLPVIPPNEEEMVRHKSALTAISGASGGSCVWLEE